MTTSTKETCAGPTNREKAGLYVDAMDILIGGFPDFYDQEIRDIIRDNFDLLWGYDPDEWLAEKVGAL